MQNFIKYFLWYKNNQGFTTVPHDSESSELNTVIPVYQIRLYTPCDLHGELTKFKRIAEVLTPDFKIST